MYLNYGGCYVFHGSAWRERNKPPTPRGEALRMMRRGWGAFALVLAALFSCCGLSPALVEARTQDVAATSADAAHGGENEPESSLRSGLKNGLKDFREFEGTQDEIYGDDFELGDHLSEAAIETKDWARSDARQRFKSLWVSTGDLDFGEVELCEPMLKTIVLSYDQLQNANSQKAVELIDWEAADPQVQVPMFTRHVLHAGDSVPITVSLLPWQTGPVETAVFLQTSSGRFLVRVTGYGVPSRYGLEPLVGAIVGTQVLWRPNLEITNPQTSRDELIVEEVYTTEGFLHLRVEQDANWILPPGVTQALAALSFQSLVPGVFQGFVRIKLAPSAHNPHPNRLLVPISVEVVPEVVSAHPRVISFGTLVRRNTSVPYVVPENRARQVIALHNYGESMIEVIDITASLRRKAPLSYMTRGFDQVNILVQSLPLRIQPGSWSSAAALLTLESVAEEDGELSGELVFFQSQQDKQVLNDGAKLEDLQLPIRVPIHARLRTGSVNVQPTSYMLRHPGPRQLTPLKSWNSFHEPIVILDVKVYAPQDAFPDDAWESPCESDEYVDHKLAWVDLDPFFNLTQVIGTVIAPGEAFPEIPISAARMALLKDKDVLCRSRAAKTRYLAIYTNLTRVQVPLILYHGRLRASAIRLPDEEVLATNTWNMLEIRLGRCALDSRTQVRLQFANDDAIPIHVRKLEHVNAGADSVVRLAPGAVFPETIAPYSVVDVDLDVLLLREFLSPETEHVSETWMLRTNQGFTIRIVIDADIVPGELLLSLPGPLLVESVILGDEVRFGPVEIESSFNESVAIEWDKHNDPRVELSKVGPIILAPFATTLLGDLIINMSRCEDPHPTKQSLTSAQACRKIRHLCADVEKLSNASKSLVIDFQPEITITSNLTGLRFTLPVSVKEVECPQVQISQVLSTPATLVGTQSEQYVHVRNPSRHRIMEVRIAKVDGGADDLFSIPSDHKDLVRHASPLETVRLGPFNFAPKAQHAGEVSVARVILETNLTGRLETHISAAASLASLEFDTFSEDEIENVDTQGSDALDASSVEKTSSSESCTATTVMVYESDFDSNYTQNSENTVFVAVRKRSAIRNTGISDVTISELHITGGHLWRDVNISSLSKLPVTLRPKEILYLNVEIMANCSTALSQGIVEVAVNPQHQIRFGVDIYMAPEIVSVCSVEPQRTYKQTIETHDTSNKAFATSDLIWGISSFPFQGSPIVLLFGFFSVLLLVSVATLFVSRKCEPEGKSTIQSEDSVSQFTSELKSVNKEKKTKKVSVSLKVELPNENGTSNIVRFEQKGDKTTPALVMPLSEPKDKPEDSDIIPMSSNRLNVDTTNQQGTDTDRKIEGAVKTSNIDGTITSDAISSTVVPKEMDGDADAFVKSKVKKRISTKSQNYEGANTTENLGDEYKENHSTSGSESRPFSFLASSKPVEHTFDQPLLPRTPDANQRTFFPSSAHSTPVKLLRPGDIDSVSLEAINPSMSVNNTSSGSGDSAPPKNVICASSFPKSRRKSGKSSHNSSDSTSSAKVLQETGSLPTTVATEELQGQAGSKQKKVRESRLHGTPVIPPSRVRQDSSQPLKEETSAKRWSSPSLASLRASKSRSDDGSGRRRRPLQAPWKQQPPQRDSGSNSTQRPPLNPTRTCGAEESSQGVGNTWQKSYSSSNMDTTAGSGWDLDVQSWRRSARQNVQFSTGVGHVPPIRSSTPPLTQSLPPVSSKNDPLNVYQYDYEAPHGSRPTLSSSSSQSSHLSDRESSPSLGPSTIFGPQLLPSLEIDDPISEVSFQTDNTTTYFSTPLPSPHNNEAQITSGDDRLGLPDFSVSTGEGFYGISRGASNSIESSKAALPQNPSWQNPISPPPGLENVEPKVPPGLPPRPSSRSSHPLSDLAEATNQHPIVSSNPRGVKNGHHQNHHTNFAEQDEVSEEPFGIMRALSLQ